MPRVRSASVSLTANTTTDIVAAPTNSTQIVVLSLSASGNPAAGGVLQLKNSSTVMWQAYLPTVGTTGAPTLVVEPSIVGGELFRCSTNTALTGTTGAITNPIYVNVRYIYEDK